MALVVLACSATVPVHAQQQVKPVRIGIPYFGTEAAAPRLEAAFYQGMRNLGYVEGQSLLIERRCCANGSKEQFGQFMADLIQRKVDIVLVATPQAAVGAKQATTTIPIVFVSVADPVKLGLVANLAHPGGNVTGFTHLALGAPGDALGKQMELIKDLIPSVSRVAILINSANPMHQQVDFPGLLANLAKTVGVTPIVVDAHAPADLAPAFEKAVGARAQAIVVTADTLTFSERVQIAALAAKYRLPATYYFREHVEAGGLMSYGVDLADLWLRAAGYVDKIAKGTKPGDLPVERPARFELVINSKVAKSLGLTIPPALLRRVDEFVE
jgi:putative ABC transport system substrate-binding protein